MTYDEWLATLLPFEAKALTRREIFQAGAASRDAYIERLETGLLQVRKELCGDIHNTDDLLDLIASRDAEVVSLTNQRDYEYVRAENAEQERDQLREQVKMLRALCMEGANGFGRLLISTGDNVAVRDWQKRCKDAVAATEPKP